MREYTTYSLIFKLVRMFQIRSIIFTQLSKNMQIHEFPDPGY